MLYREYPGRFWPSYLLRLCRPKDSVKHYDTYSVLFIEIGTRLTALEPKAQGLLVQVEPANFLLVTFSAHSEETCDLKSLDLIF